MLQIILAIGKQSKFLQLFKLKCRKQKYLELVTCWKLNGMILLSHPALFSDFASLEISLVNFSKAGFIFILRKHYD